MGGTFTSIFFFLNYKKSIRESENLGNERQLFRRSKTGDITLQEGAPPPTSEPITAEPTTAEPSA